MYLALIIKMFYILKDFLKIINAVNLDRLVVHISLSIECYVQDSNSVHK